MSKIVKIPTSMNPFIVTINGVPQKYPAGATMEVPDNIAAIIEQYEKGSFPQPAVPETVIKLVSPGGKVFVLSVSDEGELSVEPFVPEGMIAFYYNGTVCLAKEGMTWAEWIGSDYDTNKWRCEACGKTHSGLSVFDNVVCCANYDENCEAFDDGPFCKYQERDDFLDMDKGELVDGNDKIVAGCWYG